MSPYRPPRAFHACPNANFRTARKTRCDGVHPSCGSCARRSLPCNYVNDREGNNPKGRPKTNAGPPAAGTSAVPSMQTLAAQPQLMALAGASNGYAAPRPAGGDEMGEQDLKRGLESETSLPNKKPRVMDDLGGHNVVAVTQLA